MYRKTDRVVLGDGKDCIFSSDTNVTGINNNVMVVGGSGSGKTVSIAEPFLLESNNRNIITSVTKRRIVKKYTPLLEDRGYKVWDLDFVHPENGNVSYDPLNYIKSYQDIIFIARAIVQANVDTNNKNLDPYWYESATSLFVAIISYILIEYDDPDFSDVLEMVDKLSYSEKDGTIVTNYDSDFELLQKYNPLNMASVNWMSFKRLPVRTAGCVFSFLNTALATVFTPELRKMFKMKNRVNFNDFTKEKSALFITSSPVNPSLNSFINMFYAHTFKELFEIGEMQDSGVLPIPIHFLADDFATGCPVPLFDQYISIFREKGISVTLLIQSESQLSSLYGYQSSTTIINNCDTYVYMGSNDLDTAKNISDRAGIMPEDCLSMKLGKQIIFRRGLKPIFCKRYNVFKNKKYQEITNKFKDSHVDKIVIKDRHSFIKELKRTAKKSEDSCIVDV